MIEDEADGVTRSVSPGTDESLERDQGLESVQELMKLLMGMTPMRLCREVLKEGRWFSTRDQSSTRNR